MSVVEGIREEAEAPRSVSRGMRLGAGPTGERALARRDLYRFLASVFLKPPEADLLRRVIDASLLAQLGSFLGGRAVADLGRFAMTARVAEDLESLRQEYMDLLAVPTGRYVTPFEDVYRGATRDGTQERGPLLGPRAIAVKRAYRAAGARLDRACKELPTHVGVELSFMSFLCGSEAEALSRERGNGRPPRKAEETRESDRYREFQAKFLEEHLNDWFPRLSEAIQMCSRSLFYRGLAVLTEEFLAWDAACVSGEARSGRKEQDPEVSASTRTE